MFLPRVRGALAALSFSAILPFSPAFAADGPSPAKTAGDALDPPIVVTGTKGDFGIKSGIPLDRVPQSVQVLGADELVARGVDSIAAALRTVPSANIGNSRVSRYQSFSITIRGFLADQMRNGIRQRYYEDVDASALSNIERIEVLKGPSSVLYGQSAVGGIISVVTRQPGEVFAAEGAVTVGSFDTFRASLDVGGPITETLSARVTGEIERSGSFVDFQDIDRENLAVTLRWAPAPGFVAHLVAEEVRRRTLSNPGLPVTGTVVPNGIATVARKRFLGEPAFNPLEAESPLLQAWADIDLGGGWSVSPRLQYSELNTPFTQIRVTGVDAANPRLATRNGRIGSEDDSYTIAQLDLTGRLATGPLTHDLLLGYEYDRERSTFRQFNFAAGSVPAIDVLAPVYLPFAARPPLVFAFDFAGNIDGHAVYAQDRVAIGEALELVLGLRHAWIRNEGFFSGDPTDLGDPLVEEVEQTAVQAGATWRLGGGLSLYGGYNTGYDVENIFGLSPTLGGQTVDPETSDQVELGLRLVRGGFSGSIAAFRITRANVAGDDPDNPGFSRNFGSLRVQGVEMEGQYRRGDVTLSAGYAFLDDEIVESADPAELGGRISGVARHSANARGEWRVADSGFVLRGGIAYQSERAPANASALRIGETLLVDAGIGYARGPLRIDLVADNLFDEVYYSQTGSNAFVYPGDPRSVSLRFALRY